MAGRPASLESQRTELLMEVYSLAQESARITLAQARLLRELASIEERRVVSA